MMNEIENLITFSSIKELQEKNLQLIRVVRKLSEEREKEEEEAKQEGEVKEALKELESLKEKRTKQEEMIKTLIAQRDMYKVLLAQSSSSSSSSSSVGTTEREIEMRIKKEKEKFTEEIMKQVDELNKLNNGLKEEVYTSKMEAAKAVGEMNYHLNRLKEFEGVVENQRSEIQR